MMQIDFADDDQLIDQVQQAKLLGVTRTTLWRWERKYKDFPRGYRLPGSVKVYRSKKALLNYVFSNAVDAQ